MTIHQFYETKFYCLCSIIYKVYTFLLLSNFKFIVLYTHMELVRRVCNWHRPKYDLLALFGPEF